MWSSSSPGGTTCPSYHRRTHARDGMRQDGAVTQPVGDAPHEANTPDQPGHPPPNAGYPVPPGYAEPPAPAYQPPPAPQGWGASPAAPVAATATTEGTAVVALVCAILSWLVLPVILAIVALVLAGSAEGTIDRSGGQKTGRGLVNGTRWIAWIHLLVVAMIIAFVAAFVLAVAIAR
jgi:hypothetical protein